MQEEYNVMKQIEHPNVVKLYDMYQSPKKVYMVLELLTGGELFDRIVSKGNYSEQQAAEVMRDLCKALKYLHGKNIVHRDLKPENILYSSPRDDATIKITDFGLAKASNVNNMSTACGTPGYVAPEVLKSKEYGPAVDVWSAGVILYILLCGFPPFYHRDTLELYKQIKKGQYAFPDPYWTDISAEAKDLVQRMLTVNPELRFTPDQVLAHPWISNKNTNQLGGDFQARMQLFQARSRLRKGLKTIIAVNRFARALENVNVD